MSTSEVLQALQERNADELSRFSEVLLDATSEVQPVWFSKPYDDFFWHCATTIPNWLPRVVAACATTEGSGAHALLKIWSGVDFHREAEDGILRHAKDEATHAQLFVQLARLAFEQNFESDYLDTVQQSLCPITELDIVKSDRRVAEQMLIDYLIQLNIVEIRTRHHLRLLAPMYYSLAPACNKGRVERILNGLARDETSHIGYTAKLIDDWANDCNMERLKSLYKCRLHDYNQHTLEHCDVAKHDYGQGRFAALFND